MNKNWLITFSGNAWDPCTKLIVERAEKLGGVNKLLVYDDKWLMEHEFYRLNQWLWDHRGVGNEGLYSRGFGWFVWKPFILLLTMQQMELGDVVMYLDGDTYPIADFRILYSHCRGNGIMLFSACGCTNLQYVKRDTYEVMAQDHEYYARREHAVARFMLFEKGPWRNEQFLIEWLTYCLNPRATTFDVSVLAEELTGFKEPRSEQAIFSLLAAKYGHRLYREACSFGNSDTKDWDLYGQLFEQGSERIEYKPSKGSKYANVSK